MKTVQSGVSCRPLVVQAAYDIIMDIVHHLFLNASKVPCNSCLLMQSCCKKLTLRNMRYISVLGVILEVQFIPSSCLVIYHKPLRQHKSRSHQGRFHLHRFPRKICILHRWQSPRLQVLFAVKDSCHACQNVSSLN